MTNGRARRSTTRRRRRHVAHQRRVEREFRKKYRRQALDGRTGALLPPTIWNYRKALVFNAASAQDRGIEEMLTTRMSPGSYRTNAVGSMDNDH